MDEMTKTKMGSTLSRYQRAMEDEAFDVIRNRPILETNSAHFLKVLETQEVCHTKRTIKCAIWGLTEIRSANDV